MRVVFIDISTSPRVGIILLVSSPANGRIDPVGNPLTAKVNYAAPDGQNEPAFDCVVAIDWEFQAREKRIGRGRWG